MSLSYDHDVFGEVSSEYIEAHRRSSVSDWKRFARKPRNETLFKNSVTLLDNVAVIVVKDADERDRLLKMLRKHGVTSFPDGRRISSVVMVQ